MNWTLIIAALGALALGAIWTGLCLIVGAVVGFVLGAYGAGWQLADKLTAAGLHYDDGEIEDAPEWHPASDEYKRGADFRDALEDS